MIKSVSHHPILFIFPNIFKVNWLTAFLRGLFFASYVFCDFHGAESVSGKKGSVGS